MGLLTLILGMLAATTAGGTCLIAAFTLGLYGWPAVLTAFLVGSFGAATLALPLAAVVRSRSSDLSPPPSFRR
jgi:hypothetical protein